MSGSSHELALLVERSLRGLGSEAEVQRALEKLFVARGMQHVREYRLDRANRIDFMVGTIGVEVKIGGGISAVIRQLHRYAEFEAVSELVLVTTRIALCHVPPELNGKRVRVALLLGGLL